MSDVEAHAKLKGVGQLALILPYLFVLNEVVTELS